jgi:hypothetical protein
MFNAFVFVLLRRAHYSILGKSLLFTTVVFSKRYLLVRYLVISRENNFTFSCYILTQILLCSPFVVLNEEIKASRIYISDCNGEMRSL